MPIQYQCTGCQQPIEVDDEHAGKSAACPYCRQVATIPLQSTYAPSAAIAARPAGAGAYGAGWPAGRLPATLLRLDPLQAASVSAARAFGNYALICAALAIVLLTIGVVRQITLASQAGLLKPGFGLNAEDVKKMSEAVGADPWAVAPVMGALFFALAGLALSITSLIRSRAGNWRAITAGVICGSFLLCNCASGLLAGAAGLSG
jgi:hypothetical protein